MDRAIIKEFLSHIELFKDLDDVEHELLLAEITELKIESGKLLFEENTTRERLFIIFEGEIELFKRTPYDEETRLTIFLEVRFSW